MISITISKAPIFSLHFSLGNYIILARCVYSWWLLVRGPVYKNFQRKKNNIISLHCRLWFFMSVDLPRNTHVSVYLDAPWRQDVSYQRLFWFIIFFYFCYLKKIKREKVRIVEPAGFTMLGLVVSPPVLLFEGKLWPFVFELIDVYCWSW